MAGATMGMAFRHLRGLFGGGSVVALEDGQLLARYEADGDEAAFEALIGRHGPMVLTICRAVLRNEHDVEDAFQATFLVLARKARSIRRGDTLGGWLHRVAYRASVQASVEGARRRRKEAEAAMVRSVATKSEPGSDLAALLHEEIDRLPERHRLPVVLCDLEGLTYEQAARQLRWTVPTLRNRLARARQRLKARLASRGMIIPAIGASASVPPSLARATLSAATGGSASLGASLLTRSLLKGMLMTKLKIAGLATLASLALASACVIAAGGGSPPDGPGPALKSKAQDQDRAATIPAETVEVRGRVVDAGGKPVAGAAVRGVSYDGEAPVLRDATSGPDGRFLLRLPRPTPDLLDLAADEFQIVASSPGHGIGLAGWASKSEPVVRLAPEGPPIEGRVIDLEGRPVAGAAVRAHAFWFDEKGEFPAWIARARNGAEGNFWQGLQKIPLEELCEIETRTGADGRFKLTGIGRDRIAELLISGPRIATTQAFVFSRDEPEFRSKERPAMGSLPFVVEAPRFQLVVPPNRRVEGVARDKDTGRPIAGLEIEAASLTDTSSFRVPGVKAKTDADGRYRIDGLPRAETYQLIVEPSKGLPYPNATLQVRADTPPLEPVAFDFALKRGVVIRGTVTDKVTGRPIVGCYATYHAFGDNPNLGDYPGFDESQASSVFVEQDGHFEIVALPGRGLVEVRDEMGRYLPASGFEQIPGYNREDKSFHTVPVDVLPRAQNALVEVVVDTKAGPMPLDFRLDPGRSVTIQVVDPDGRPSSGTMAKGLSELFATNALPQSSDRFEVHALEPGKLRRVVVMHQGRKLIGSILLKGTEAGPITIQLQPWGSVAGRIVNDEGKPRKGMLLTAPHGSTNERPETDDILPWTDWNGGVRVGDDGRFRIEGLVPGLRYAASTSGPDSPIYRGGDLFEGLTVTAGEAKDLGDLKVKPAKP